jgi:hypothetical protein
MYKMICALFKGDKVSLVVKLFSLKKTTALFALELLQSIHQVFFLKYLINLILLEFFFLFFRLEGLCPASLRRATPRERSGGSNPGG